MSATKIIAIAIYLGIGLGVVGIEAKEKPGLMEDRQVMLFSMVLWPAFPAAHIYERILGEPS